MKIFLKNFGLIPLVFFFLVIFYLIGCGGGGGGGGGTGVSGFFPVAPSLSGKITTSGELGSIRSLTPFINEASSTGRKIRVSDLSGVEVYLEENRSQFTSRTDPEGRFKIEDVPLGQHNLVGNFQGGPVVFKARSETVSMSDKDSEVEVPPFEILPATRYVRGILRNSQGQPIPFAKLQLWGEEFRTNELGEYLTPPMPDKASAEVKFLGMIGMLPVSFPMIFVSPDPPFIETTIISATETNQAPRITITANQTRVQPNDSILFSATAVDPENDRLNYKWSATSGKLASESSDDLKVRWTAPEQTGMSTISFEVVEARQNGLSSKANVPITVGSGKVNTNNPPVAVILATPTGEIQVNAVLDLVASGSDPDGDSLNYTWLCDNGNFLSKVDKETFWQAPDVATLSRVTIVVKDARGEQTSAFLELVTTLHAGNRPPEITLMKPASGTTFALNEKIDLKVTAGDTEDGPISPEKIYWFEGTKFLANATDGFSLSFSNPVIDTGIHYITVRVSDSSGSVSTIVFAIIIGDNQPPVCQISSPNSPWTNIVEGTSISFLGAAADKEDGIISKTDSLGWSTSINGAMPPVFLGSGTGLTKTLSPGTHTIFFSATDSLGGTSSTSKTIFVNRRPIMDFSPGSGTNSLEKYRIVFDGGFSSDPESGPVKQASMKWYLDGILSQSGLQSFSVSNIPLGDHLISLAGEDNYGVVGSVTKKISIIPNPPPDMAFSPASGATFFAGSPVPFSGSGNDSDSGMPVSAGSMTWFCDGNLWKNGISGFSDAGLSAGEHVIKLKGLDQFGFEGEIVKKIRIVQVADVVSPASGSAFAIGSPVVFSGNSDPLGNPGMSWLIDGTLSGTGGTLTAGPFPTGKHLATFIGTDSAGFLSSDSIGFEIKPIATISISVVNTLYSTDTANVPIYMVESGGGAVYFVATASFIGGGNAPGDFLAWYVDDFNTQVGTGSAYGGGLPPGTHTVVVKLYDKSVAATETLEVWNSSFIGGKGRGNGQMWTCGCGMGMGANDNNFIYSTDSDNSRVLKFKTNGDFVMSIGTSGSNDGEMVTPKGVGVSSDGSIIYVADSGNNRIQKFDSNGNFITKWGSSGGGDGQFSDPVGVAVSMDGNFVYITDRLNRRVQKFDSSGNFISKWGSAGAGDGQFACPRAICVSPDGNYVYVSEGTDNHRIQKFDSNGVFQTKWTGFNMPSGMCLSRDGEYLFITEFCNHVVKKIKTDGSFSSQWGGRGAQKGQFVGPGGIALSGNKNFLFVLENFNCRIQKITIDSQP